MLVDNIVKIEELGDKVEKLMILMARIGTYLRWKLLWLSIKRTGPATAITPFREDMKNWYVVETEDTTSCSIYAAPNQALLLWDKVIKLQFLKV